MWKKICATAEQNKEYGFSARSDQIANMRQSVSVDPRYLVISTFRLVLPIGAKSESVLYAFLYSELKDDVIVPKYFCANPSFESKDGEYRPKIGKYENLEVMVEAYPGLLDDIDTYLTAKKEHMGWSTEVTHFYTFKTNDSCIHDFKRLIDSKHLQNKLLYIMWFSSIYNIYYGMIEVHTNEKFNRVLGFTGTTLAKDTKFIHDMMEKYSDKSLRHLRQLQHYFYSNPKLEQSFRLGQKIIPLSLIEAQRVYSIGYKPWRELLVSTKLADLVVNRICPSFAMTVGYFYIERGEAELFDNTAQTIRTELSKAATGIAQMLRRAKTLAIESESKLPVVETVLKEWAHEKFQSLDEIMDEAIMYNKKEMILSNVALCIFSEFMGKTLHNAIESAMRSELYNESLGDILGNSDTFAKFIFEFMYGFLCANYHGGVIHSDVHLNNLCIHPMYSTAQRSIKLEKPRVAYDLAEHGEGTGPFFAIPSTQYYGSIIDFSRCIVKVSNLADYSNSDLEYAASKGLNNFTGVSDVSSLMLYSICRVRYLYRQYMSEFYAKHTVLVEVMMREHFLTVFHLFTAFDPLMFCLKLREFINRKENKGRFNGTLPTDVKLLDSVIDMCRHTLSIEFVRLAKQVERTHRHPTNKVQIHSYEAEPASSTILFMHEPQVEHVEWKEPTHGIKISEYPLYKIIVKCFPQFSVDKPVSTVFDQYSIGYPVKYSIDSYESLPPSYKNASAKKDYARDLQIQHAKLTRMNVVADEHFKMFF